MKPQQRGLLNKGWFYVLFAGAFLVLVFAFRPALLLSFRPLKAYKTPSDSMCPAICAGERFLADMGAYGKGDPRHGDIIMFEFSPGTLFTKRVVGVGGDLVSNGSRGEILVNGRGIEWPHPCGNAAASSLSASQPIYFAPVRVPQGSFFVVGDNLPNSFDSRIEGFGFVRREQLRAKPVVFYWSPHFSRIGCDIR